MSDMRDAFVKTMDNEEGGMMGRIDKFSELLKEKDEEAPYLMLATHRDFWLWNGYVFLADSHM